MILVLFPWCLFLRRKKGLNRTVNETSINEIRRAKFVQYVDERRPSRISLTIVHYRDAKFLIGIRPNYEAG